MSDFLLEAATNGIAAVVAQLEQLGLSRAETLEALRAAVIRVQLADQALANLPPAGSA